MDFQTVLNIQVLFVKLMFDEQSVYWFGDIHRLSLSLCQGHSTTQLMQMRVPKNFTSIFNVNACVLLGMILRCVILYFVARTSLYSCTVCVSGLWQNEVKCCFLGLQPLSFSFNFYFIFHFKLSCADNILRMVKIFVQIAQHDKHDIENFNRNLW